MEVNSSSSLFVISFKCDMWSRCSYKMSGMPILYFVTDPPCVPISWNWSRRGSGSSRQLLLCPIHHNFVLRFKCNLQLPDWTHSARHPAHCATLTAASALQMFSKLGSGKNSQSKLISILIVTPISNCIWHLGSEFIKILQRLTLCFIIHIEQLEQHFTM